MGEGAPRAGLPVPIFTGGGISCFLPREGASLGCGRGVARVGGLTSVVGSFLDVPLRVPCCSRFLFYLPPHLPAGQLPFSGLPESHLIGGHRPRRFE